MKKKIILPVLSVIFIQSTLFSVKFFSLSRFSGAFILKYQKTNDLETYNDNPFIDFKRDYFEGGLHLNTEGSIYHPNLLTFNIDFTLFKHRTKSTLFTESDINNAVNDTYDINLHILKKKPLNFQIYGLKNFTSDDRPFSNRYYISTDIYGLKIFNSSKFLPFVLDLNKLRMKSESLTYTERDEESKNIDLKMEVINGERLSSDLQFRQRDYSESVFGVNYKSLEVFDIASFYYGPKERNYLTGIGSYHKMTEDVDLDILQFKLFSRYYFTDKLDSNSSFTYSRNITSPGRSVINNIYTSLNHHLFDSLISTIFGTGRIERAPFQDLDNVGIGARFNYKKKIKKGMIFLGFEKSFEEGKYRSNSDISSASQEMRFSYNDSIILTNPGIQLDTLIVTDPQIGKVYIEGIDYSVNSIDSYLAIIRIPGSSIPGRGSVRITYDFLSFPDHDLKKNYTRFNFHLMFMKYFNIFYKRYKNDMKIDSIYFIQPYESYSRDEFGARIVSRHLTADYIIEDYDSTFTSFRSRYLNISASFNFLRYFRLSGNYTDRDLDYKDNELFTDFNSSSAILNFMPRPGINFSATYRKLKYDSSGYFSDRESIILKLNLQFRKILIDIFYENLLNSYNFNERRHKYLNIIIRRMF